MPVQTKKPPIRRRPPAKEADAPEKSDSESKKKVTIEGIKYFAMLLPLLDHLHGEQCQRDTVGNRTLHYDQYCMLVMLYVLNPTVSSLRSLS